MKIKQILSIFLLTSFLSLHVLGQDLEQERNKKIVVLGSSVASGWVTSYQEKYDMQNGYAYRLARLLEPEEWELINISIPGFDTKSTIERFDADVLPQEPAYVLIGLSMSNEGLETQNPDTVSVSYETGIRTLINLCREHDIQPVVGLCYSNDNYTEEQYAYLKKMNSKIASWDVPSINFLGVLDDGHGHFPAGFTFDPNHPDDRGHEEMFYAVVPDMFDAMQKNKDMPAPDLSPENMLKLHKQEITYVPGEVMHSFSMCYNFNVSGASDLLKIKTANGNKTLSVSSRGLLQYDGAEVHIKADKSHHLAFTHQYLINKTVIFLDGKPIIQAKEQLEPLCFSIGSDKSDLKLNMILLYRAALNEEEVRMIVERKVLNGSLEVASLITDKDIKSTEHILANHALSTGNAVIGPAELEAKIEVLHHKIDVAHSARQNELKVEHRKPIDLDPEQLDQYVGTYEVEPGDNMLIVKENGALYLDDHGRKAPILPEGNDQFFIHYPGDILVIFQRDGEGNISGLIFSMNGREMKTKKIAQ